MFPGMHCLFTNLFIFIVSAILFFELLRRIIKTFSTIRLLRFIERVGNQLMDAAFESPCSSKNKCCSKKCCKEGVAKEEVSDEVVRCQGCFRKSIYLSEGASDEVSPE